jgi:hypothetical protein
MTLVTDVLNNKVTANFIITEPTLITIPLTVESNYVDMLNACKSHFQQVM